MGIDNETAYQLVRGTYAKAKARHHERIEELITADLAAAIKVAESIRAKHDRFLSNVSQIHAQTQGPPQSADHSAADELMCQMMKKLIIYHFTLLGVTKQTAQQIAEQYMNP